MWLKSTDIESLFDYILKYSYLLPVVTFLLFHKKIGADRKVITILVYCGLIFIILYLHDFIPRKYRIQYHYQSWFTFVEYIAFALIFFYSIQNRIFSRVILGLSIGFVIFQIIFTLTVQSTVLDSVPVGVETILIFLFSFYFFYQEFKKESQLLMRNAMFWVSIGIFFYLAGSFFFNILANHMTQREIDTYWYYTYLFDIVKNCCFAVGFILYRQAPKAERPSMPFLDMDFKHSTNR